MSYAPSLPSDIIDLAHTIVHVLDDLYSGIDARTFGDSFHEGIVSLMVVDYLENSLFSTISIHPFMWSEWYLERLNRYESCRTVIQYQL